MAALFFLLMLLFAACLYDTAECILFVEFPDLARQLVAQWRSVPAYLDYLDWLAIGVVAVLWITLVGLAFTGSMRHVPLLRQITRSSWAVRLSFFANSIVLALIPLVAAFAIHATSLTRRSSGDAAVYFLYDEGISVPRYGYALGLYRISLQARRNWGARTGGTVLDRLTTATLRTALANARVIILATHGSDGNATTWYSGEILRGGPPDSRATDERGSIRFLQVSVLGAHREWCKREDVAVNSHLQLAYIFACDAGAKAAQWKEHVAPAQVVTYNRTSTVWDHAVWFAFSGPAQLAKMK